MSNARLEMKINISSTWELAPTIIRSLVWSHNGTELIFDSRVSSGNNGTSLTISNMVESDAGKYEVKINTTDYNDGGICDRNILPILANYASYAPVTFVLRESNVSTYYPEDVISHYALPAYQGSTDKTFDIDNAFIINVPAVFDDTLTTNVGLHKDGVPIRDMAPFHRTVSYGNVTTQSLRITYNNTEDVIGRYYHEAYIFYFIIDRGICPQYRDYLDISILPVFSLYWNIRSYSELR